MDFFLMHTVDVKTVPTWYKRALQFKKVCGAKCSVIFSPIPARASRAWAAETRGRTRPTGLARAHRVRDGRWLGGGGKRVRTAGRRQRLCAR